MNRTTRTAEAAKKNKQLKLRRKKTAGPQRTKLLLMLLVIFIAACVVFFLANGYFFKVRNWTVTISGGIYSYEDIIKASGIEEGAELFGFERAAAQNNIRRELPYVSSVNIRRFPPSTVRIDVQTDEAVFGIMLGGDYYIITENFRVAEKIRLHGRQSPYFKPPGIEHDVINIVTNDVIRCVVGERIEFGDSDIMDFLEELLKFIRGHQESSRMISSVDIRDKFDVVMNYSDIYSVRFGVFENVYAKAVSSFDVIERLKESGLTGIIDVGNAPSERTVLFMPN